MQSTKYLLELGKFHRLSGIPHDYFGVMGTIFVHAVRPYWEEAGCMSEETEDVWMALFAHIARGAIQYTWGPYLNDVYTLFGIFDPLPPLSTFWQDS